MSNQDKSRRAERYTAVFAAHVSANDGKARTALIRDLSVTGAKVLTRAKLQVGDPVTLDLVLSLDTEESHEVHGKIVRIEQLEAGSSSLWSRVVAIQFDEPLTALEDAIRDVAENQARISRGSSEEK